MNPDHYHFDSAHDEEQNFYPGDPMLDDDRQYPAAGLLVPIALGALFWIAVAIIIHHFM